MLMRLRAGDTGAMDALYDRFTPLLYSVALRITGRAADAEDVVQQTWTQAWQRARSYDPARGSVPAWLIRIARTRGLDLRRSLAARTRHEESAGAQDTDRPDPAASVAERQRHERVRAALAELHDGQRQVLLLAYFDGLAQSEIADRIGKPLGTVKTWTRRGLAQLRERMGEDA